MTATATVNSRGTTSQPKVIVIGAGFGGLAAAIRLQARGYRVTLLEKRDRPGGRGYVHRVQGYTFDCGPTLITAPWLLEELFELAGQKLQERVQLVPLDPCYRIVFQEGGRFDYYSDPERMEAEIQRFSPGDVDGYRRFMQQSERVFHRGYEEMGDIPFCRLGDCLKILPAMMSMRLYRTVWKMVAEYVRDDRLRQVMSFHPLLIGGNPFRTTAILTLIHYLEQKWGVWFTMGGMGAVIDALLALFREIGGEVELDAEVQEISTAGRRATGVVLKGGRAVPADIVVSNAEASFTYRTLLSGLDRRRWTDRKLDRMRYSMGLYVSFFGLDRQYADMAHHTILLGPRYRELLDDIFERKILADDASLYIHRPTATDPSLAPAGCDAGYVLSPVPHLGADIDWRTRSGEYQQRLYGLLDRTVMPGFGQAVKVSHAIDPLHFRDVLMSHLGAGFSFEPRFDQSAWFRPHNQSEELDNLFLVGAGTHPGAGIPGVLSSARVIDRLIPRLPGDPGRDPIAATHVLRPPV